MLRRLVSRAVGNELVKGLVVGGEQVVVFHLQSDDDTIFFLKPDGDSFVNILTILGFYEAISGLKINLAKSGLVGINVDNHILNAFASLAGCQVLQWPITYVILVHFLFGILWCVKFLRGWIVGKVLYSLWEAGSLSSNRVYQAFHYTTSLPLSYSCGYCSKDLKTREGFSLVKGWGL